MYNVKQEVTVTILASHNVILRGSSHVPGGLPDEPKERLHGRL